MCGCGRASLVVNEGRSHASHRHIQPRQNRSGLLMRWLLILWAAPLMLFWSWYFLSLNNIHFGYVFLTRDVHDIVFGLYGEILGIDPATIPLLAAKACLFDSLIISAIVAFRRRRQISAWAKETKSRYFIAAPEVGPVHPAE
jgi:hypothetical protein